VGLANLGSESETCVGSRIRLVGVFISFEKNFYRLPFTPPSLVRRIGPSKAPSYPRPAPLNPSSAPLDGRYATLRARAPWMIGVSSVAPVPPHLAHKKGAPRTLHQPSPPPGLLPPLRRQQFKEEKGEKQRGQREKRGRREEGWRATPRTTPCRAIQAEEVLCHAEGETALRPEQHRRCDRQRELPCDDAPFTSPMPWNRRPGALRYHRHQTEVCATTTSPRATPTTTTTPPTTL
jgi:hypothetical protein